MFAVRIAQPARQDLQEQHDWWAEHRSAEQAARWYQQFFRALLQLEEAPTKFSLAAESGVWPFEIRQLNFGIGRRPTHRALFRVKNNEVIVLRVRHLAQDSLTTDDI
jgi:plasmid stabilization system protein ParE